MLLRGKWVHSPEAGQQEGITNPAGDPFAGTTRDGSAYGVIN
jgi:hypothetical protein